MVIEILAEDRSGSVVVKKLTEDICRKSNVSSEIFVRPHRGCGSLPKCPDERPARFQEALLDLLPAKCRAYEAAFKGQDFVLVVVMDSDDHDPDELRKALYACVHKYAPSLRSVIGLCTEEVEAWMLGDKNALWKAYPGASDYQYSNYVQDSICGTWEALCRVLCPDNYKDIIDIGYPAIGNFKKKWADEISGYMDSDLNASPSFWNYKMALTAAIKNPKPIPGVRRRSF